MVEVILTEDVPKLGQAGDVVRVRSGYGRNYLLPQGKAMLATRGRVADLEHKRRLIEEKQRKLVGDLQGVARQLDGTEIEFEMNASAEGKLFGSVTLARIAEELATRGFSLDRRKITLAESIKRVGDYDVTIKLHREVEAAIRVRVVSSGTEPEMEPEVAPEIGQAVGTGDIDEE
ncbi:MAG: 50S ribosomal protein L9 [Myxococcota bacterium]